MFCLFDMILHVPVNIFSSRVWTGLPWLNQERSGSVVECLTGDRGAAAVGSVGCV